VLLAEEAAGHDQATIRMRRRASGLPAGKDLRRLGARPVRDPPKTQRALQTLKWIDRAEVLVICGPARGPLTHCLIAVVIGQTIELRHPRPEVLGFWAVR